ncbi:FSR family fosmidomycin resistance protein-like MFS transporter [Alicyclobacillus sacchari]|uniref:FSR family fosmidomycin resistance protein-like MFS transporter n=1 Tax=Alicyclobacillus sacchari TaxID=392010 RepID=A0A4R8LKU0_9BACL|nr:MFS transporter [Alicyclobacillus sacchari]TDY43023.1 FSR family fosmidomycin resistance protein-like MFS transporter [Alicyclobacillus sacchari]GMA57740.1 putative MFS-type transporter YfnC [Alicyclobacillus sacchari]
MAVVQAVREQGRMNRDAVWSICGTHVLNDVSTTGLVPALTQMYKPIYHLNYTQISLIVLVSYLASSISQPLFGAWADRHPRAWMLPLGLFLSTIGIALTGIAPSYSVLLIFVAISGLGSGAFHPEASRATHLAAGRVKGLAQAIFQVGGNGGQAIGPLIVSLFLLSAGIRGVLWMFVAVALGLVLTLRLYPWYRDGLRDAGKKLREVDGDNQIGAVILLVIVIVLRSWCQIGIAQFMPFYYAHKYGMGYHLSDTFTFVFLGAGAIGTFIGGALADKMSKQRILLYSMLCSIPFGLGLPFFSGLWALVVLIPFGFFILSSFAVTVVYMQHLLPRNISLASGLTIGFGVGAGGIGATFFGILADHVGLSAVFYILMFVPVVGAILSACLPNDHKRRAGIA